MSKNDNSIEIIKRVKQTLDDYSKEADEKNPSDHRSYVYALCERKGDTLIPFYIGEGKGDRVWQHEWSEQKQIEEIERILDEEQRLAS